MAMTLATFRTRVRKRTRHTNTSDPRLTDPNIDEAGMEIYRDLRTWLQDVAPSLYQFTASGLAVDAAIPSLATSSISATFERAYRVSRYWDGLGYRAVEHADALDPNEHRASPLTWREQGGSIIFGADNDTIITGLYEVTYWVTPADITNPAAPFEIPTALESALVAGTCAIVAINDGDARAQDMFEKRYENLTTKAKPALKGRKGAHPVNSGFRRVLPY